MPRASKPHLAGRYWRFRYVLKTYRAPKDFANSEAAAWAHLLTLQQRDGAYASERPLSLSEAIVIHRQLHPARWNARMTDRLAEFAGSIPLSEIETNQQSSALLSRFSDWLHCATYTRKRLKRVRGKVVPVDVEYTYSPKSINHYVQAAAQFMRWCADPGEHGGEAWCGVPTTPELNGVDFSHRAMDAAQVSALAADLKRTGNTRMLSLISFCLLTGCRPGEARTLEWSQVQLAERAVVLPPSRHKSGHRTKRNRVITLPEAAVELLERLPRDGYWVFPSRNGTPYTYAGLRSNLRRRGVTSYQFRHTWFQTLADLGVSDAVAAEMGGHTSVRMLPFYRRIRDDRLREAADSVASRLAGPLQSGDVVQVHQTTPDASPDQSRARTRPDPRSKRKRRGA